MHELAVIVISVFGESIHCIYGVEYSHSLPARRNTLAIFEPWQPSLRNFCIFSGW